MMKLSHWWTRLFRGAVAEEATTASGDILRRYASGYVEHIDKESGAKTDVMRDLHRLTHGRRTWKCFKTQGGAWLEYPDTTKARAVEKCSRQLGPVIYTDDQHGFIFYRDAAGNGGADVNAPLPR